MYASLTHCRAFRSPGSGMSSLCYPNGRDRPTTDVILYLLSAFNLFKRRPVSLCSRHRCVVTVSGFCVRPAFSIPLDVQHDTILDASVFFPRPQTIP